VANNPRYWDVQKTQRPINGMGSKIRRPQYRPIGHSDDGANCASGAISRRILRRREFNEGFRPSAVAVAALCLKSFGANSSHLWQIAQGGFLRSGRTWPNTLAGSVMSDVIAHRLICLAARNLVPIASVPYRKDEPGNQEQRSKRAPSPSRVPDEFASIAIGVVARLASINFRCSPLRTISSTVFRRNLLASAEAMIWPVDSR
jgi:hypothetical protein